MRLELTCRYKQKGSQVAPAELEDLLLGHQSVADVAVTAIPRPEEATEVPRAYGQLACPAWVIPKIEPFCQSNCSLELKAVIMKPRRSWTGPTQNWPIGSDCVVVLYLSTASPNVSGMTHDSDIRSHSAAVPKKWVHWLTDMNHADCFAAQAESSSDAFYASERTPPCMARREQTENRSCESYVVYNDS